MPWDEIGEIAAAVTGLALLAWGLGAIYWPLAPCVVGLSLMTLGIMGARNVPASSTSQQQPDSGTVPPE